VRLLPTRGREVLLVKCISSRIEYNRDTRIIARTKIKWDNPLTASYNLGIGQSEKIDEKENIPSDHFHSSIDSGYWLCAG
jgi:hypothetical protein